jgi:hypothetical protein
LDVGLDIGLGGLTLDFAGSMFRWASGTVTTLSGDLINLGTMNIVGYVSFLGDGALNNFGTIVETGGGLSMHSDNATSAPSLVVPCLFLMVMPIRLKASRSARSK